MSVPLSQLVLGTTYLFELYLRSGVLSVHNSERRSNGIFCASGSRQDLIEMVGTNPTMRNKCSFHIDFVLETLTPTFTAYFKDNLDGKYLAV